MKTIFRLLCGWMAIALAACTGDELQQIEPLQKPVAQKTISVKAYTPSEQAATRLAFEDKGEDGLKLSWTAGDAFTALIDNNKVRFEYDEDSKEFTANVAQDVTLTDGIVAYYPAYDGENFEMDLSQQTGQLNGATTYMEGVYSNGAFRFTHSTAILKATFSGLPQEAEVASIKIGAAPYTISILPTDGMYLAEGGIYIYLPNVAKNENVVFSVSTTAGEVYTATQAVVLDEGIKVGTYYVAPIALTPAACNLPTGNDFNTALNSFLQGKDLTQITFIANSVNTDNSNPIGSSNAYMVANGNVLEIHTAAPKFVFNENCSGMFSYLTNIQSIDFGNCVNTSNVVNMDDMFNRCYALTSLNVSSFNTANVEHMSNMFNSCSSLTSLNVSSFNTENVRSMYYMFNECYALTSLDLSNFNTANVTSMANMFNVCSSLTSLNVSSFNTANVEHMSNMFNSCSSLTSLDLSSFNFDKVENFGDMFTNLGSSVTTGKIPVYVTMAGYNVLSNESTTGIDDSYAKYMVLCELPTGSSFNSAVSNFLDENSSLTKIKFVTNSDNTGENNQIGTSGAYMVANGETLEIHTAAAEFVFNADCSSMFAGLSNITAIDFGNCVNTSKVVTMDGMFNSCSSLTSLDLRSFNTSKVVTMDGMFNSCYALTSLNVSSFNTANVTSMVFMFSGCQELTSLNVSSFNTANVIFMYNMFFNCESLSSLDLSSFNTAKVENMSSMFNGCSALTSLDLSSFDFKENVILTGMFTNLGFYATNTSVYVKDENDIDKLNNPNTGIPDYAIISVKQP
ncbi:MAG: BspA family leucine-rich repeat surface protein [Bacteroides sp.]|nr:BspA family leucine-rich repeat surface protein [Bacteroides sp.]